MQAQQYVKALDRLGLNARSASELIGVAEVTAHKWQQGVNPIPEPVARLVTAIEIMGLPAYTAIMRVHRRRTKP